MSDLHVGAVTRIVVEEAARLRLPAIIASRRQCDVDGGYLGWTQGELVHLVKRWSGGHTQVIRDHGGPGQGRGGDDGIASLEADLVAGFDSLHLDVCKLPRDQQLGALTVLLGLFGRDPNGVTVEVGAEHEDQQHNARLVQLALNNEVLPAYAVVGAGTHVHAERQIGAVNIDTLVSADIWLHERGIRSKIHNCDWLANRAHFVRHVDAYNLAPELAQVEVDAWLKNVAAPHANQLLHIAYDRGQWGHWFDAREGTFYDRARCGLRYVLETEAVRRILEPYRATVAETNVRQEVVRALERG